tara:strand:- start:756 stop:1157 length:402 start_codon:yes stop_codon:yes gene_type:complete
MSDYNNTNSGVMFTPHADQRMIGQGKLNVEGGENRVVFVKEKLTRDGEPIIVMYRRSGILFNNNKNGNDDAPDYSGPLDDHPNHRIAAWKGEKEGRKYLSLRVSEKQNLNPPTFSQSQAPAPADVQDIDEIPF